MDELRKKYIFAQLRSLPNATQYVEVTQYIEHLEQQCKKQKEVIDKALDIAYKYGQTDGGHHKMWVIDQMVRTLLKDDYDKFVKEYEKPDKNDDYYEWDTGIAP